MDEAPELKTTPLENATINKFLTFAIKDVEYQLKAVEKMTKSVRILKENRIAADYISDYLKILQGEVEKTLSAPKTKVIDISKQEVEDLDDETY